MSRFADMPFERKLRLSMLLTSTLALLLACSVFLVVAYFGDRSDLEHTVTTLARLASDNSAAAVAFSDAEAAAETLQTLRAEPQVAAAAIYDAEGLLFARYTTADSSVPTQLAPGADELTFEREFVTTRQAILAGDRRVGTVYLQASMTRLNRKLATFVAITAVVLIAATAFAWVLASLLQRTLARPILELASTAGAITALEDWSLRARRYGRDELGRLTDDFNLMLERTQHAVTALRESESELRLVTDNAPVYLARLDRSLRFKFVNLPYAAYFNSTPDDLTGQHIRYSLGEKNFQDILPYMKTALRGEQVAFEIELSMPRDGARWLAFTYVPEAMEHGKCPGFVSVTVDVTERKRGEQEVARARDEAVAASRAKDDFLAALSHELRTPLSPVLLLASERAGQEELDAALRRDFKTIRANVELEARLIDDLLDLTRIARGKLSLQRQPLNFQEILEKTIETVRSELTAKHLVLVVDHRAREWIVEGDAVRLQQVLWNILKNAIKFTSEGGTIELTTRNSGPGALELTLRDNGIGMTPEELERVFDAFSQGDHIEDGGSHRFGGLGLGLAIARMLVELHGGTLHAASPGRGRGTTLTLGLPLAKDQSEPAKTDVPDRVRDRTANAQRAALATGNRGRILLTEDHTPTRDSLLALLGARGLEVEGAASLAEAKEMALQANPPFGILISDIGLPDGDGCDLMRFLRDRFPDIRGMALSGYGMETDLARSRAAGFSTHLTKPISMDALERALSDLFQSV